MGFCPPAPVFILSPGGGHTVRPCVLPRRHGRGLPKVTALSCSSLHGRRGPGPINHSAWGGAGPPRPFPAPARPLARPGPKNVLLPVNTFIFNCLPLWEGRAATCRLWLFVLVAVGPTVMFQSGAPAQPRLLSCCRKGFGSISGPSIGAGSGPTAARSRPLPAEPTWGGIVAIPVPWRRFGAKERGFVSLTP